MSHAAGNVTNLQNGGRRLGLGWNGRYQVTAVTTNGALAEKYGYDALGRRVFVADPSTGSGQAETNWFVYDGPHVVADVNSTGGVLRTYAYGPGIDNILSMSVYTNSGGTTTVSSVYYYVKDHLGTVHALVNTSGTLVESYKYDAWGRVLAVYDGDRQSTLPPNNPLDGTVPPGLAKQGRTLPAAAAGGAFGQNQPVRSALGNRYLWQGREYSWKTGLYYFRARWYDPVTARWLSNDPIGISGGLNQYVFCRNTPVNYRDPFGLSARDIELLRQAFNEKVAEMIRRGQREPGSGTLAGLWNNFINMLMWFTMEGRIHQEIYDVDPPLGCGDQALEMFDAFRALQDAGKLDDNWTFDVGFESKFHQRGWATSSNPDDPVMDFDPWRNFFDRSTTPEPPAQFNP